MTSFRASETSFEVARTRTRTGGCFPHRSVALQAAARGLDVAALVLEAAPASMLRAVACGTPLSPAKLLAPLDAFDTVSRKPLQFHFNMTLYESVLCVQIS